MKPQIDKATYAQERTICDKAAAYFRRVSKGGNSITAKQAAAKIYAACNNAMRGRVEQFELLTDTPSDLVAYLGKPECGRFPVQVWTGLEIGHARVSSSWSVNSHYGSRMFQFHAWINGREFTGRGFGEGMCIRLKETATSKRERAA